MENATLVELEDYQIDNLDRQILAALISDARRPFTDIADELGVSGGTIHVRVDKLKSRGIIRGSKFVLDYEKLGYQVAAFIGVVFDKPQACRGVLQQLEKFAEVTEAHYTTGKYGLFLKVCTQTMRDLHLFLATKLQTVEGVQSTETIIALDNPIERDLTP